MNIGIVGLGRMGSGIAQRLARAHFTLYGYDVHPTATFGFPLTLCSSIKDVAEKTSVIILMVPAGEIVDKALTEILTYAPQGTIIIDGGNSNYADSIRRAALCKQRDIFFLDCGTSGGLHGKEHGYCLMIGGEKSAYEKLIPVWEAIAAPHGYVYTGPSGSGHYVKMVHNGIEYGILQAYAEGFHLLKEGEFANLDLGAIGHTWEHGSVIRSWLLELLSTHLKKDATLSNIPAQIGENGTGRWMRQEAQKSNIPTPALDAALEVRAESQKKGGNYGTKIVSLARLLFGGHVQ
jgi:6-phosphogluconate dehydrogenase